jgi:hypothetical protein
MSPERYAQEVADLQRLHPQNLLIHSLLGSHSSIKEAYLKKAWRLYHESQKAVELPKPVESSSKMVDKEALNALFRQKGHINRAMRQIKCNALACAKTVSERKSIMQDLAKMQSEWATVQQQIRVYDLTGQLPQPAAQIHNEAARWETKTALWQGMNDMDLLGQLNVLRASHSRCKGRLEAFEAAVLEKSHPKHATWSQLEATYKRLSLEKQYVESLIKQRKSVKT